MTENHGVPGSNPGPATLESPANRKNRDYTASGSGTPDTLFDTNAVRAWRSPHEPSRRARGHPPLVEGAHRQPTFRPVQDPDFVAAFFDFPSMGPVGVFVDDSVSQLADSQFLYLQ